MSTPQRKQDALEVANAMTLADAAAYLDVHPATIRRWVKGKRLVAYQLGPAGRYLFAKADLDSMVERRAA
jgi:excisionase family DNA binding protein